MSPDANTIMVAADKTSFCWKLTPFKDKKKYSLIWDNGDELFCHKTKLCNCKGLSPANKRVFEQYGAIYVQSTDTEPAESAKAASMNINEVKALQNKLASLYLKKKDLDKSRQLIDNEIDEINQTLLGFYSIQDIEPLLSVPPPIVNKEPPPPQKKEEPPKEEEYQMDPELAALLKNLEAKEEPKPEEDAMDPELAALLKNLEAKEEPKPEEDAMDPELAALLKNLEPKEEEDEGMDPELAALLKKINDAT